MRPVVKLRDISSRKNLYHGPNKKTELKPEVEVLPTNTTSRKKAVNDKTSSAGANLNTLKSRPQVGLEKSSIRKNPYFIKNSSRFKSDEELFGKRSVVELQKLEEKPATRANLNTIKSRPRVGLQKSNIRKKPYFIKNSSRFKSDEKLIGKRPVVKLQKLKGELATGLNTQRKNPFHPNSKPSEKKDYDENQPLSKLRRNIKMKKLNAKPLKKELKKSTFDENEPLSKLRRRDVKTKKEKKELRKLTLDEILKQDGKLLKLRKNPFYKKPSIAERKKELLPAQVKLRKLDINNKSLFKKFPKLVVRKF